MIIHYIKIAWRNILRYKSFSIINILGLALGMACSILILLWVHDEKTFDNFHKNGDRLFAIYESQYIDGEVQSGYYTPGLLGSELKKNVPEIEFASGFAWANDNPNLQTFESGDKIIKFATSFADADYFKMMSYPLVAGNASVCLLSPESICISRKMANAFFGSAEAAMGKTIRYENRKELTITGVFENLPANTAAQFNCLINWKLFLNENEWAKEWGNNGPRTYIMLREKTDSRLVASKIEKFLDTYNKDQNDHFRIRLGIQPVKDLHLYSNFNKGKIAGGRIEYVRLFSIVAIFILLIACINFMNLATARSIKRAKEIGIRKASGAARSVLVKQFLSEALLITVLAVALSLFLVTLLLPLFNELTAKQIVLPFSNSMFWLVLSVLTLVTGFIAGIYPALFLSSFKPVAVLKGALKFSSRSLYLRRGLVVFQFVLSVLLITGTIVVSQQVEFIQKTNLGYNRENLLYIPVEGDLQTSYQLFKQEAVNIPGVKMVSRIGEPPTAIGSTTGGVEWEGKNPNTSPQFSQTACGYDFVKTIGAQLVAGREFSKDFVTDSSAYIINESAQKIMGFKDAIGKPITFWQHKGTVVGVLKDFHFASLHDPITPLILRLGENDSWGNILVKVEGAKTKQVLTALENLCKKVNPKFPFTFSFADEEYQKQYASEQVINKLSNYFAFLAIFISCLGLLGLAMFTAEQRTKEIGIRKVLGATVSSVFSLLSKEFLQLVVMAMLIATPLAWWAMHNWLQGFAYKINISWWVFAAAGLIALLIALLTVSFQAVKAAMANPIRSLRTE